MLVAHLLAFLFKQVIDGLQLSLSCFRYGLELFCDGGGDGDFDGVCLSVGPASCSCAERSFRALIFFVTILSCAEGSTCFWSPSYCSFDNFPTAPVRRCLRDFGFVASCVAFVDLLVQSTLGNHGVRCRLLMVNPANLLCGRGLLSLFHKRPDGTRPKRRQQTTMLLRRLTTTQAIW